jgi:hypothetical protein
MQRAVPAALESYVRLNHLPWPRRSPAVVAAIVLAGSLAGLPTAARAEDGPPVGSGDTIVGELVQGYADPGPSASTGHGPEDDGSDLLSWVQTAPGEAVRVPTAELADADADAGDTVEVTVGGTVQDEASAEGLEPAREVLAAEVVAAAEEPAPAPASTTGPANHLVTVVMLQPAGVARDSTTLAQVQAAVNGPVADFWAEQSGGAVRFGVAAGVSWTATAATCQDPWGLWQAAIQAATWQGRAREHLLVYVPARSPGCSYGLGTVGAGLDDGGLAYVQATETSVIAHEFGHNLGLGHSSAVKCDRAVETGSCQTIAYADHYDVMGVSWGPLGTLNAPHAAALGLLPAAEQVALSASSAPVRVTLVPVSAASGTRALRITDAGGVRYWVEYRQASGRDAWLGSSANGLGLQSGVTVRRAAGQPDTSMLLDGSPSAPSAWTADRQVVLPVGSSTLLSDGDAVLVVREVTSAGATVEVADIATTAAIKAMSDRYRETGGPGGPLGLETGNPVCGLPGGGCSRPYRNGSIYSSPGRGAFAVYGDIAKAYDPLRGESGVLGYPVGSRYATVGGGATQAFQGGRIHWSPGTGAHAVFGDISRAYDPLRGESGVLGYPVGGRYATPGNGWTQAFQFGRIHTSPGSGAHAVFGDISRAYDPLRGESGVLGYPVGGRYATPGNGWTQAFQFGRIHTSPDTGAFAVYGDIARAYDPLRGESGPLGYPVAAQRPDANGQLEQLFQKGRIVAGGGAASVRYQ